MVKIIFFSSIFIVCSIVPTVVTSKDLGASEKNKQLYDLLPFNEESLKTKKNLDLFEDDSVDSNSLINLKNNKERFKRSAKKRFIHEGSSFYQKNSVSTYERPHRTPDYDYNEPLLLVNHNNNYGSETNVDYNEYDDLNPVIVSTSQDAIRKEYQSHLPSDTPILLDAINDVVQLVLDIKNMILHSDDQYIQGMRRAIGRTIVKFRSKPKKKRKEKDALTEIVDTVKEFSEVLVDIPKAFTELGQQLKNTTMDLVNEIMKDGKEKERDGAEEEEDEKSEKKKKKKKRTSEEENDDEEEEEDEEY